MLLAVKGFIEGPQSRFEFCWSEILKLLNYLTLKESKGLVENPKSKIL